MHTKYRKTGEQEQVLKHSKVGVSLGPEGVKGQTAPKGVG